MTEIEKPLTEDHRLIAGCGCSACRHSAGQPADATKPLSEEREQEIRLRASKSSRYRLAKDRPSDSEYLLAEIDRLRAEVARLEAALAEIASAESQFSTSRNLRQMARDALRDPGTKTLKGRG